MRVSRVAFFVFALPALATFIFAQDVLHVEAKAIQQHIDHKAFPTYPPIAKAAHIQGTVVFDLRIGTTGKIESMKVVSGHPMLQQAAIDCLKQWTFHPFENNGAPFVAEGQYSIIFVLGDGGGSTRKPGEDSQGANQQSHATPSQIITVHVKSETSIQGVDPKTEQQFQEYDDACKHGILTKEFNDATVSSCRQAAEVADRLPVEGNYISKRSAFVYAATAYGDVGDFKDALLWADKAVDIIKLGHDSDSGSSAAYSTRGEIEGFLGDYLAANRDLTAAEDIDRKAAASAHQSDPEQGKRYEHDLARNLQFHAKVLQALSRQDEAKAKLNEAAKYQ
jgi:TonB family protein